MPKWERLTRRIKKADPYTMHHERVHRPAEKYMKGGPSDWAEDQHKAPEDGGETPRNEIGLPEFSELNHNHQDADEWNSGGLYDNQKEASMELEKRSLRCVKVAQAMLPNATASVIEDQAFDLMRVDPRLIDATLRRILLAKAEEAMEEEEDSKEAMEDSMVEEEDSKEAMEEDSSEEEEEDSKEAMEEDSSEEEGEKEEAEEEAEEAETKKEACVKVSMEDKLEAMEKMMLQMHEAMMDMKKEHMMKEEAMEDEAMDEAEAMLEAMMEEEAMEDSMDEEAMLEALMKSSEEEEAMHYSMEDLDIDIASELDSLDGADLSDDEDEILASLINPAWEGRTASKKGIKELGRVTGGSPKTAEKALEALWQSAPDVSDAFK